MRKNSKKGFTIVELVIVIAVIAILAAVLIPTFSGIIDKANTSADIQLIREANMLIQAEMIDLDRSLTKEEADKVLTDNGIDISKITNTANEFYYISEKSCYIIWNIDDSKITYPEDVAASLNNWTPGNSAVRIGSTYYATLTEAVNGAKAGDTIIVLKDIETSNQLIIDKSITIDFDNHTYTVSGTIRNDNSLMFQINSGAKVLMKNGTVKMLSDFNILLTINKGNVTVTNMNMEAEKDVSFRTWILFYEGDLTINDTTVSNHDFPIIIEDEDKGIKESEKCDLTINGKSSLSGKIVLREQQITATVNSDREFNFYLNVNENRIPSFLTMKLAKGDYPNVKGYTWSEPDANGYRTLTKNP